MRQPANHLKSFFCSAEVLIRKRRILGQLSACARAVPSGVPPIISFIPCRSPAVGKIFAGNPMANSVVAQIFICVLMLVPPEPFHESRRH